MEQTLPKRLNLFCSALIEQQYLSDVLWLVDHGDPQIRGATAILCGAIIHAALTKTRFNIQTWQASVQSATGSFMCLLGLNIRFM